MSEENRIGRLWFDSFDWLEQKRGKGDIVNILVIIIGNETKAILLVKLDSTWQVYFFFYTINVVCESFEGPQCTRSVSD